MRRAEAAAALLLWYASAAGYLLVRQGDPGGDTPAANAARAACYAVPPGVAELRAEWQLAPPAGAISILTPNSSSTQWRASSMAAGQLRTGDYRCRVTDAVGAVVNSATVVVTLENVATGSTPGGGGVMP